MWCVMRRFGLVMWCSSLYYNACIPGHNTGNCVDMCMKERERERERERMLLCVFACLVLSHVSLNLCFVVILSFPLAW